MKDVFFSQQRAKKVVSDSLGIVDFAITCRLNNSVCNLPEGQMKVFGEVKLHKNCNQCLLNFLFLG